MKVKNLLEQTETRQEKKTWVTPEIFDSPVIAITEGSFGGSGSDSYGYS